MLQAIQTINNSDPFEMIKKADVVSFDVFDTAIVRPFLHHHEMYHIVEKLIKFPKFYKTRIKAEYFTRKLLIHTARTKQEVTMLDIYEHIHINTQTAINAEISLDIAICRQRRFVYQLYQFAINTGKRVIFTTDITYPTQAIVDILHKNGYTIYEKIYVSAEYNLSKHHGGMYKKILSDMHTTPRKILHIGDSIKADIHQAKKNGLRPLYIPRPYHCITKFLNEKKFQLRTTPLNSALFGCASNIVFNSSPSVVNRTLLLAFPMVYKLTVHALKTQNNVFVINAEVNNQIFNIFERIYTSLHGSKPKTVHININHLYASCVRTFEDMERLYTTLQPNIFAEFLETSYKIHNIANIESLRKYWSEIEMQSLKIRQNILESIKCLPDATIYNFTPHDNIKPFAQVLLNKELPNFYSINKVFERVINHATKRTITGKPKAEMIINQISSLLNKEIQTVVFPQVEQFFSTIGKYLHLPIW